MHRAVALLSGGLDSGVALGLWLERGNEVASCLSFHYGQRSAQQEVFAARKLAHRYNLPWQMMFLPWLGELAEVMGSALVSRDRPLPGGDPEAPGDQESARAVWVPARNAVFLSIGAAVAEVEGAGVLLAGFNREEAETFPDNSAAFVEAADRFLKLGTRNGVRVDAPTLDMDKIEIAGEARRLGFRRGDFWSCYEGGREPCGSCESCLRSRRAWGSPVP